VTAKQNPFRPLLARRGVVILDGGLATELEARGADLEGALWSARLLRDDPDLIREVHAAYLEAGADCIITASYQATPRGFGSKQESIAMWRRSVQLAREAGGERPALVAASVGPYGAALANGAEYTGDYPGMDEERLYSWHRERFEVLARAGADLLACETIPSFPEARALARLLRETEGVWAWFSFSCRDDRHLRDSTPISACAALLDGLDRVAAIGVNCTAPRHVESLLLELNTRHPILAYPNSGEAYDAAQRGWSGEADPEAFGASALRWRAAGASILGGCCRTGPGHIRKLRALLVPADL